MAKPKITAADVKKAAGKAASKAREKAGKLLQAGKERAGALNKALRETKHRRMVDGVEVAVGAIAAGAAHGAGVDIDWGDTMPNVPMGVPGGVVLIAAGMGLKSYDAQALGLGALSFGLGRMAEDMVGKKIAGA